MYLFSSIRKNRAVKSYIRRLGKDLAQRYGRADKYTPGQVVKTAHDCGYNMRHICYAHALYISNKHFDEWHLEQGENCDYDIMREEISTSYFSGNSDAMSSSNLDGGFDSGFGDGAGSSD